MSLREIPCPCCGDGVLSYTGGPNGCWVCDVGGCQFCGPDDDPNGLKVLRLLSLPDPAEAHDDLEGWQCQEMCKRFGGQWCPFGDGSWQDCVPYGGLSGRSYSWRPSPPEPVERRTEGLTVWEVAKACQESPENRWATTVRCGNTYRAEWRGRFRFEWWPREKGDDSAVFLHSGTMGRDWTLHELVPAEEGE